jgi:hypothetical protein
LDLNLSLHTVDGPRRLWLEFPGVDSDLSGGMLTKAASVG